MPDGQPLTGKRNRVRTGRPTVLIVNDERTKGLLLQRVLGEAYEVLLAQDGADALEVITEAGDVDLVLLDVLMPRLDGYEVCRRLKGHPETQDIPVIFLSSLDAEKDEALGLGVGAVDYISEPFSPSILLARVKTHVSLARSRRELQARSLELAQKHQSLEWTHRQLKETLESRTQLISTVSHDLRSPLTSIQLSVDRIQAEATNLPPKALKALEILSQEAIRLNEIVKGILDKNRAESLAERLNLAPSSPRAVLAHLEDTLSLKAEDRGLRSHLYVEPDSLDAPLLLNVAAMRQVIFNLLENALKFTDPPGDIGVRSTVRGSEWLLEVWDSGRGIPRADCERLFRSFEQSQAKDAKKGWGLGLFICRTIVVAHGGRIEVDSDKGKGAIFQILLPLAPMET